MYYEGKVDCLCCMSMARQLMLILLFQCSLVLIYSSIMAQFLRVSPWFLQEYETKMLTKRPGQLSAALKEALGMDDGAPPFGTQWGFGSKQVAETFGPAMGHGRGNDTSVV